MYMRAPCPLQVWWDWPAAYRDRDAATLAAFSKEHVRRIDTFVAVQFLFDHFWSAAKVRGVFCFIMWSEGAGV